MLDKTPTTLDDQSIGVMNGLAQLAERFGADAAASSAAQLDIVVHGTTTADNTMIEMDGAPTGLLVTEGHRDEIEMRRVHKEEIWDPVVPGAAPDRPPAGPHPDPRARRLPTATSCSPLDEDAVRRGRPPAAPLGVRVDRGHVPVLASSNPEHERRAAEIIREEYPDVEHISLSHEVMARGPEFERVSTTLVNAYVAPRIAALRRPPAGEAAPRAGTAARC